MNTQAQAKKSKGNWKISKQSPLFDLAMRQNKRCYLLQLPGELRNYIYDLVFDAPLFVEMVSEKVSTEFWYQSFRQRPHNITTIRCPKRLGNYTFDGECSAHWRQSRSALLLTCSQLYYESAPTLYKSATFIFHSACRLHNFLISIRPFCLAAVNSVYFHHTTYGHPKFPTNEKWKAVHLRKLASTIGRCAHLMKNVTTFHLSLQVDEVPLRLSLDEYWVKPFLKLEVLSLRHVQVIMHDIRAVTNNAKEAMHMLRSSFAFALEKRLMGEHLELFKLDPFSFANLSIDDKMLLEYLTG